MTEEINIEWACDSGDKVERSADESSMIPVPQQYAELSPLALQVGLAQCHSPFPRCPLRPPHLGELHEPFDPSPYVRVLHFPPLLTVLTALTLIATLVLPLSLALPGCRRRRRRRSRRHLLQLLLHHQLRL